LDARTKIFFKNFENYLRYTGFLKIPKMAVIHVLDEIFKWGLDQKLSFAPSHTSTEKLPRRSKVKVTKFEKSFQKITPPQNFSILVSK
jgi:hypothetical protein